MCDKAAAMSGCPVKSEMVACFVVAQNKSGHSLLILTRASTVPQAPGISQIVYGHINASETPVDTALREVTEETGLTVERLYSLNETFSFYDITAQCIQLTPVFVALVDRAREVIIDKTEHICYEWVPFGEAAQNLPWPSQRRAFIILKELLAEGDLPEIMRINISNRAGI